MIELQGLTKHYPDAVAVDDLSFEVRAGQVTGFLGPNGAGKSTTMRMILGLDHPTAGRALLAGRPYAELPEPLREVGAQLETESFHPGRTARSHLRVAAHTNGIPRARVEAVLDTVGLTAVADRRVATYSLGMRQRLGIAGALLGDPGILLFDEPVNGLDADGVRWVRDLVRRLAAEGRTVLVSSHLMSEMQRTADHLLVIGRGRLIADASIDDILAGSHRRTVRVRSVRMAELAAHLIDLGAEVEHLDDREIVVAGASAEQIGDAALEFGIPVHHLTELESSLEEAYTELTSGTVQYATPASTTEEVPA